ncbi:dihydroorotase [Mogibacterium pumilum]|uniref:Dihydroorotase n=1 Tax=Mogibacterium pumilum TaxID=86332 RepID=A0A223ATB7_9FIRM|nr:dihydroorotase [Mogibacterium pumilum]ASS38198.1 dihydroorotase [Mogibacterium pumilum]
MTTAIKGGKIYKSGEFTPNELFVVDAHEKAGLESETGSDFDFERVINADNSFILPSFCDIHVHFREPGQSYKETISTGSKAAAHGGYTTVCTMPNLNPAPSTFDALSVQLDLIKKNAYIEVIPYGTITLAQNGRGELADMDALAPYVCAFSDDGRGVQADGLMREAMYHANDLGKLIVAHCEDESLLREGKVRESEWKQIERDLKLADETGAGYHVCHISCKESVEVIRDAKKSGVNVTCETAPHYLVFDTDDINTFTGRWPELGGRFKMNPPIKDRADKEALIEGLLDGTVDMIATDHAPHSTDEKSRGFVKSPNGITGLECAFPALYTYLVKPGVISLEHLVHIMSIAPRERFGFEQNGWTMIDLDSTFRLDATSFLSLGKCTPFDGHMLNGLVKMTVMNGKIVYENLEK